MRAKSIPLHHLLVKPAGPDCNLACQYCFYLDKQDRFPAISRHRMTDQILERLIKQALEQSNGAISFAWQGGEPTLMGLDFFERVVAFQREFGKGQLIGNALQTNGLRIDDDWAGFLAESNFLVGLSLDGPAHIHDRYRTHRDGQGSFQQVMKALETLQRYGVAMNVLSVITDDGVRFPAEIYGFFREHDLTHMQFIPYVAEEQGGDEKSPHTVDATAYGTFLCTLFDLWLANIADGRFTTSIRFFDALLERYLGQRPTDCTLLANCGNYLTVEHDGSVYACDFFVEDKWQLGNVLEDALLEMLNSQRQIRFGSRKSRLPEECLQCEWLELCRGGCPKDRNHHTDVNMLCAAFKAFFAHAAPRFERLAVSLHEQRRIMDKRAQTRELVESLDMEVSAQDPCPCGSGLRYGACCMPTDRPDLPLEGN